MDELSSALDEMTASDLLELASDISEEDLIELDEESFDVADVRTKRSIFFRKKHVLKGQQCSIHLLKKLKKTAMKVGFSAAGLLLKKLMKAAKKKGSLGAAVHLLKKLRKAAKKKGGLGATVLLLNKLEKAAKKAGVTAGLLLKKLRKKKKKGAGILWTLFGTIFGWFGGGGGGGARGLPP